METAEIGVWFLAGWFVASAAVVFVLALRRYAPRDLDKELAPPGADLLDLSGRRW